MYGSPLHAHWPHSFAPNPEVDPAIFEEEWGHPWAYPADAGFMSTWPEADTGENPSPNLGWPTMYEPHHVHEMHFGPHHVMATHAAGAGDWLSQVSDAAKDMESRARQKAAQAYQAARQAIPNIQMPEVSQLPAFPNLGDITKPLSDEGKRTLAMAQAGIADANRHVEDTSKAAQDAAQAVKYVAIGVGALLTVSLLFHIVKQASE